MIHVNPEFLTESVLDPTNPRTRIRFAMLDRLFGPGKWAEIYVDVRHPLPRGTVRVTDGTYWDWDVEKLGHANKTPA